MLAVTVIKNTVISAFGIFKSVSCLIRMRLSKNFFSNMFFYHFLQFCPRSHISKMLAVTVTQNMVTKRLWNFQIRFLPYSNAFEKKFFFSNMFFYHFFQLCPRGHISKMLAVTVIKNTVTKRLWNFQIRFLPYSNAFEKNFFFKHVLLSFSSTLSPRSYLENACCNRYQKHGY